MARKKFPFKVVNVILLSVFVLLLLLGAAFLFQINQKMEQLVGEPSKDVFTQLMTRVTLTIPETDFVVTLDAATGKTVEYGDFANNPQAGYGTVTLLPEYVVSLSEGQIVGVFAVNSGGSGELFYLAVFEKDKKGYHGTSAELLGDRIKMQELSVQNGRINIFYMDHSPKQAMVDAPDTPVKKQFVYNDKQLIDVLR